MRQSTPPVAHATTNIEHLVNTVEPEPLAHELQKVSIPPMVPLVVKISGRMDLVLDVFGQRHFSNLSHAVHAQASRGKRPSIIESCRPPFLQTVNATTAGQTAA